ncbi:polysaccharide deacetylase family protein [Flavobacterium sp.]|uniref:polysaccharide deacetylase family protein n=1 Tax=Flavobacterium sp. TaxID=239 RepID=UPI002B4B5977|nr:polysaccharide deacetylase family protein [Flavobacterium sp.]HLP64898.1 polysaccharide deacetylase family protein [Flavobacterium sp.]
MARLPVLMYHNVTPNINESVELTISTSKFEEQLQYLAEKNYTAIFASELMNSNEIPPKSVVLTFDDVTENQLLYALPLLKKYKCKATFFIPFAYIGKTDAWNDGCEKIMSIEQLQSLDSEVVELGHHSYLHRKYASLTADEIQDDFDQSFEIIHQNNLTVVPALAYPYGNFPKKGIQNEVFFELLKKNGIQLAFRIGNRTNKFPLRDNYKIKRIDIKGQDSLLTFKWKLRVGKLRLF